MTGILSLSALGKASHGKCNRVDNCKCCFVPSLVGTMIEGSGTGPRLQRETWPWREVGGRGTYAPSLAHWASKLYSLIVINVRSRVPEPERATHRSDKHRQTPTQGLL
ncbi:hypothetical protein J3459_008568 [Metarhizium acridum]|nr:hypothetical protein J3459_008568 [Metarhizium acridum]